MALSNDISVDGSITVNDHGLELVSLTDIPVEVEMLYGANLKNKLERNVLTMSQQSLTATQKTQVQKNIGLEPTTATDKTSSGFVADARAIKTAYDDMKTFPFAAKEFNGTYNLNTFMDSGVKFVTGTLTNCPDGSNGILIVFSLTSSWKKQIWIRMGTPGSNDNKMYIRGYNGSSWGAWAKFEGTFVS